ncbi:hypothetical protein GT037_000403 [Alternaria burnsii]|uniref:Uncharacterized protein n=1 Tax=Alternaria burnsii TaxID=1187904 RepID=A0A8H7EJK5_9PLEO|nr:uncharacterized protein GT037_000403 [Alternaria burnsii]KAF7681427.1 hypothetical protein GT037_000403 [Alternaria burnsii]
MADDMSDNMSDAVAEMYAERDADNKIIQGVAAGMNGARFAPELREMVWELCLPILSIKPLEEPLDRNMSLCAVASYKGNPGYVQK